jgi:hypothetical protein
MFCSIMLPVSWYIFAQAFPLDPWSIFFVAACAILFIGEILTIFFLIYVVFVDNAGVIVNPKGEMKGTLQILFKCLF